MQPYTARITKRGSSTIGMFASLLQLVWLQFRCFAFFSGCPCRPVPAPGQRPRPVRHHLMDGCARRKPTRVRGASWRARKRRQHAPKLRFRHCASCKAGLTCACTHSWVEASQSATLLSGLHAQGHWLCALLGKPIPYRGPNPAVLCAILSKTRATTAYTWTRWHST